MATTRRLAAILAADVAGYSRLMGADEEGILAALKAIRRELGDRKIADHRGRIVKTTGDGLLVEFQSVVDVRCAVEVQRAMAERNASVPAEKRIEFRFGIHQGDIIAEDGDIFGDGVNLAARLEGLAEPGGICVSGRVHADAAGKVDVAFDDLGEQSLKNIARPLRVYRVRLGEVRAMDTPAAALALPDKPSIAVLPFQNMSGDPEQEYFADGMVEEIITALSRIRWLFVIARNSSFTYKGRAVDVKQIGRELGVRYVLEGSVRKGGNRVRITAQLIDAATGAHLWADRFDGFLENIFELQDKVASSVAGVIEPTLRQAEIERARRKRPDSLDAYDLYLRALPHAFTAMPDDADKALPLLIKAVELEPDYAAAHAIIAFCQEQRYLRGGMLEETRLAALHHARLAIAAGGDDAAALATAGFVIAVVGHDFETALTAFDQSSVPKMSLCKAVAFAAGLGLAMLSHPVHAAPASSGDTVQSLYDVLLSTMKDGRILGQSGRFMHLDPVIRRSFDIASMARLSVGPSWAGLTEAQRQEVTESFGRYTSALYADRFDSYAGQKLEVTGEQPAPSGVMVKSQIVKANGEPVKVDYMMRRNADGWLISDIYLDGAISEVATRRSEFAAILKKDGIDGLIAALNRKADMLTGTTARSS